MIEHYLITKSICFILILLMVFLMIVTFAGCSKSKEKSVLSQGKVENNSTTQSQAEEHISKAQAEQSIVLPNGKVWDGTT